MRTDTVRRLGACLAAVFAATLAAADPAPDPGGGRRAFTIADFYRLTPVLEPAISPDERTIVYTVTSRDLERAKQAIHLWRVDPDGTYARPLTAGESTNQQPTFSPDGQALAFLSTRSGEPQVWILPMGGGEPEQKTFFPGGVGEFLWSPDGRRLVAAVDVHPDCGADAACNKKKDEARQQGALKAHLADALLYRHWTQWREGKRSHLLLFDLAARKDDAGAVRDLTPGEFDAPVFEVGGHGGFALSPDGKEVAFSSNRAPDPASSTNSDLWVAPVDGSAEELRAPKNITAGNEAWDGSPRYSPDGRFIAYRTQRVPRYESDRFRVALYDRGTSRSRILTEDFDYWVTDLAWSADSRAIYFQADVKGRTPLHELDLASGRIRVLTAVGTLDAFKVAPDERWAVVSRRRVGEPWELYRVDLARPGDGTGTRLTAHNQAVAKEVDMRPAEEMWVEAADGARLQVFIVKPHGFDAARRYPLILNIHGGPQQQWTDAFRGDWQVYPGAGYAVAFANPRGSTGFGQAFTAAISRDWNGKVMDDIARVTDALAVLPYVDAERLGAMGWSWGGYAVMWLEGHSTRFKTLASMMGVYDLRAMYSSTEELWFPEWDLGGPPWEQPELYRRLSPSEYVPNFKTPCLVLTGERDYRVPYTQSLEFFTDLQKMRVPSRLVVYERAGHWPSWHEMALYYAAHLDWFHRWLGGAPSPRDPKEIVDRAGFAPPPGTREAEHP
jgi:dipeptidyl aminopeptidase/acylaminoacyl peptidase